MLLFNNFLGKAQDIDYVTVKGKVVNLKFTPIPFVNVISKQSAKGTFSDQEGKFSFRVYKSDTIIFSAISLKTKEVAVSQLNFSENLVILDSMIYSINKIEIMEIRWKEFEYAILNMKLKPMEQKILVIKGLPDPYTKLVQIPPNMVMNPVSAIYEFFKAENIRKRKIERWNEIYNKTWIKIEGSGTKSNNQ